MGAGGKASGRRRAWPLPAADSCRYGFPGPAFSGKGRHAQGPGRLQGKRPGERTWHCAGALAVPGDAAPLRTGIPNEVTSFSLHTGCTVRSDTAGTTLVHARLHTDLCRRPQGVLHGAHTRSRAHQPFCPSTRPPTASQGPPLSQPGDGRHPRPGFPGDRDSATPPSSPTNRFKKNCRCPPSGGIAIY